MEGRKKPGLNDADWRVLDIPHDGRSKANMPKIIRPEGEGKRGSKQFFWCYDWPNDASEAGKKDAGIGQINWRPGNATSELKIENQDNVKLFIINRRGCKKVYERVGK